METLRTMIEGRDLVVAPVALNPMMARLAEAAGFRALYLSGGSLGWLKCVTEANLTLPEMVQVGVDIRTVCKLPLILDAGGDPMHMHRTIAMSEVAGSRSSGGRRSGNSAGIFTRASYAEMRVTPTPRRKAPSKTSGTDIIPCRARPAGPNLGTMNRTPQQALRRARS